MTNDKYEFVTVAQAWAETDVVEFIMGIELWGN
jgi:hypothetical protein